MRPSRPAALTRRATLALGGALLTARGARAQPPGLVITGGPIYTGQGVATVEALAIVGDRILFAGALADARRAAPDARLIDLGGAAAFPGLVDGHCHLTGVGLRALTLDLTGAASIADLQARLRAWAAHQPEGPISGDGWIETHWPEARFPTRADLDAVVADRPVYLSRADGHAGVANSKALALAGISASTANPAGGEILREAGGGPAGLLVDNAQDLVGPVFPPPDRTLKRKALRIADQLYRSRGWTGAHFMSVYQDDIDLLTELAGQNELGLRVEAYMDPVAAQAVLTRGPFADPTGRVRVRGIKLYADGALGSRGAALLAPYSDKPGSTGLVVTPQPALIDLMQKAKAVDAQVAVHAIGDRGNRNALDAMTAVLGSGRTDRRWRIEHAQVLSPQDLPRFAAMGVVASMQPSHAIGDLYFAPARLGLERLKGAYAWNSLIQSGAVVAGGSDAPVEKGDPLIEVYAAAYRHALNGFAGPEWGLDQALSRPQALSLFSAATAYAVFRESELGALAPGRRADISVFSKDLMRAEPADILKAKAVMTLIAGQVAYSA